MPVARARPRFPVIPALLALAAICAVAPAQTAWTQAPAAGDTVFIVPPEDQLDIAYKVFPTLLEMGLDVVPSDDQAQSVLSAVNLLRKQDKRRYLKPTAHL